MASNQKSRVPPDMTVGFIGAGRMAQAMARGFISTGKGDNCTYYVYNVHVILFMLAHIYQLIY